MTTIALNYFRVQKRIKSGVGSITFPRINWRVVCFVTFFMSLSLLVYYVWQVRYLTGGSYLIGSYERQITEMLGEKKDLEVSFAENSFLGQAQEKIRNLNFQKITSVKYIQLPDSSLARAK